MGKYRDRMRQLDNPEAGQLAIQSSSPTLAESYPVPEASPVVERLGVAVKYMLALVANSKGASENKKVSVGAKLGAKLATEMLSDLADSELPPAVMEFYLRQVGAMVLWTATGEKDPSLPWPSDFEV
jgi:hypothetical protein